MAFLDAQMTMLSRKTQKLKACNGKNNLRLGSKKELKHMQLSLIGYLGVKMLLAL